MMNHTQSLEEFVRFVKNRAYDMHKRYRQNLTVSVFFIKDGNRKDIISNRDRLALSKLAETILFQRPNQIEIELKTESKFELHNYDLHRDFNIEPVPLAGLGAVSTQNVEEIVRKRLEEERTVMELKALKIKMQEQKDDLSQKLQVQKEDLNQKLQEHKEGLSQKQKEIEDLKLDLESKDQTIEDLEESLQSKKNFKYYAGMTGDILQSIGIKKELLAKPLAGLLSSDQEEDSRAIEQTASDDTSGIVEEAPRVHDKRTEMLILIGEYLKGVDNKTLSHIFSIFSEIEINPENAVHILKFLKSQKK